VRKFGNVVSVALVGRRGMAYDEGGVRGISERAPTVSWRGWRFFACELSPAASIPGSLMGFTLRDNPTTPPMGEFHPRPEGHTSTSGTNRWDVVGGAGTKSGRDLVPKEHRKVRAARLPIRKVVGGMVVMAIACLV